MIVYLNSSCVHQGSTWGWSESIFNYPMKLCGSGKTTRYFRAPQHNILSWGIIGVKRVLKEDWWNLGRCNYHVVFYSLKGSQLSPWRGNDVTVSFLYCFIFSFSKGSEEYSHAVSYSVSLHFLISLRPGEGEDCILSPDSSESFTISFQTTSAALAYQNWHAFASCCTGRELKWHYQPLSSPWHGAFD